MLTEVGVEPDVVGLEERLEVAHGCIVEEALGLTYNKFVINCHTMSTLELNGERLDASNLAPFGLELRPVRDRPVHLHDWVGQSIERVEELASEKLVIVLRNAVQLGEPYREIDPAEADGSTQFPHADYDEGNGSTLLMWVLKGSVRSPTEFVPSDVAAERMHRESITPRSFGGGS